ncbi:hypothetical protein M0811_03807 [Anaeramoeba ignava]|uniref:Stealth protein CR4 conserved region 4 domain-containing protein n=1 Tax=Anaeramoeba ignava TaxID=1746090 RepID=A0A9Q0RHJ9_ANAIG|nr:hypothetical protein M0811_03807 [Anaeramoeba ignava]
MDLIEKRYSTKKNNLYEMREENEAVQGFVMVYSEIKDTREKLDEVIRNRPKFMCLNDDKNYSHPEAELVTEEVAEFLELFFPFPSQFELKDGETNQFLYLDEMIEFENQTTNQKKNHLIWLFIILIILIFVTPLVVVKIIRKNRNNLPIRVWKV